MEYKIKPYHPDYIPDQVELIWSVSGKWKYNYATSVESLTKKYTSDQFDPSTRFYAFKDEKLVGYVTSEVKDEEKGKYATLRFPLAYDNNEQIIELLMDRVLNRLKELGISKVRAPAARGLGNTIDLAEKYNFEPKSTLFIRAREHVDDLSYSGNTANVIDYDDNKHEEMIKNLFMSKMGMSEKEGKQWFEWSKNSKERKEAINPNMTSWKVIEENNKIVGFSYLLRSDRQPQIGGIYPIWTSNKENLKQIYDKFLSAHIQTLRPDGLKYLRTFLIDDSLKLEPLYNEFGFNFDKFISYELTL